jgi:hypothetical protein
MADKPITRLASEMATQEQKKKRGILSFLDDNITGALEKVGDFAADQGQAFVDMAKNPLDTAKQMGVTAKQTFYDPIANLPKAFDPTSGLSPLERVNTGLGGALAIGDMMTPFMPEGALANALAKRAAENAVARIAPNMTKPVGPTAADWFYGQYGLHGSPTQGITQLEPRLGSKAFPNDAVTFAQPLEAAKYDLVDGVETVSRYAPQDTASSIYVAKYPRGYQSKSYNNYIVSDVPGKVVGEYKLEPGFYNTPAYDLRNQAIATSAPEYLLSALLSDIKSPALRKKLTENFGQTARNFAEERARNAAEMAANSAQNERRYRGLGTGGGVS